MDVVLGICKYYRQFRDEMVGWHLQLDGHEFE